MNDDGRVFPIQGTCEYGMTLRQWYAGMAVMGMWIDPDEESESIIRIVSLSFKLADTMLAFEAHEKRGTKK